MSWDPVGVASAVLLLVVVALLVGSLLVNPTITIWLALLGTVLAFVGIIALTRQRPPQD